MTRLGLPHASTSSAVSISRVSQISETQHLLGNPRRLQVGQTIDRDLSWQTQLDRVELDGIWASAGKMVQKLYPDASGWGP